MTSFLLFAAGNAYSTHYQGLLWAMSTNYFLIKESKLCSLWMDLIKDNLTLRLIEYVNQIQVYLLLKLKPFYLLFAFLKGFCLLAICIWYKWLYLVSNTVTQLWKF